jgi:RNA polymerase sigma factor (sigma-70 family)
VNDKFFEELRPVGFAVAYRMLVSVTEAEDVVQEAFLRLHDTLQGGERIKSPRAYLATVVTRLCIDHLRSARARHETYVDALPEPLICELGTTADSDPASHAEMADSLSLAFQAEAPRPPGRPRSSRRPLPRQNRPAARLLRVASSRCHGNRRSLSHGCNAAARRELACGPWHSGRRGAV